MKIRHIPCMTGQPASPMVMITMDICLREACPFLHLDGKYVVDFYAPYAWEDDDGCQLTISGLDKNYHTTTRKISVKFKTWVPVEYPISAFWISDRELIMKVYAVGNSVMHDDPNYDPAKYQYQYIKLTILEAGL